MKATSQVSQQLTVPVDVSLYVIKETKLSAIYWFWLIFVQLNSKFILLSEVLIKGLTAILCSILQEAY